MHYTLYTILSVSIQCYRYDPTLTYVSVVMSDGDNIAEDFSTLRPMLEERIRIVERCSAPAYALVLVFVAVQY
jgi:hypothetical protein